MRVSKEIWEQRANNLYERYLNGRIYNSIPAVDDYKSHINKCYIGKSVLDVGAGYQLIKEHLPKDVVYIPIDPFPILKTSIKVSIEESDYKENSFDTVYCFAMLDNVLDLDIALSKIKKYAKMNCVFLTGVNIKPDKYHTIEITEEVLIEKMRPFTIGYKEYITPKVLLIEFIK